MRTVRGRGAGRSLVLRNGLQTGGSRFLLSYPVIEHGRPLQSVLRDTPQPTGAEVLVGLTQSRVCHNDLHMWDGYFDLGGGKRFLIQDCGCVPPITLGHEP